ncbi:hypothetical protein [Bifidobacterium sp.]|jgi:hypothetical protein|uniref:hypothetical protein n=1 Tax=Bifidobacterium sp. TaxID=41200 RepID=UPI0025C7139E|nr:hypothetical protein [Bifidobacterium sp.]MCH4160891.1 hypothetical protein [Bifidobacterium sp.]MCH4174709.1 hypothetical protein [Bifidobacterium sp.]MCI1636133.1 hypothetical protein [Bifidobacterium sp.]
MPAVQRSVRSGAMPDKRRPQAQPSSTRPQLHVVSGKQGSREIMLDGARRLLVWTRTRRAPLFHIVVALSILGASLVVSLMLRTQMIENSFEATTTQQSISRLNQDIQDDQSKLDELQASLPDKAEKMGMIPQKGSISIDLQGYKAATDSKGQQ